MKQAFEEDMLPHLDAMYATALRLTRNDNDAQDLVQDAMVRAYRFYERFESGSNARGWLIRILTNTFINKYRRKTLERDTLEGVSATPIGRGVMSQSTMGSLAKPEENAERTLIFTEIEAALAELTEEYRLMIVLIDIEGLSYREAAEAVGSPVGTIMSRLFRARKQLQERLLPQAIGAGIIHVDDAPQVSSAPTVVQGTGASSKKRDDSQGSRS